MDNSKAERAISSPQGIETRVIVEVINSRGRDGGKPKIPAGGGKKWEPPTNRLRKNSAVYPGPKTVRR